MLRCCDKKVEFDYFTYVPRNKIENKCECGKVIHKTSTKCRRCNSDKNFKIEWPSKDVLSKLLWENPTTHIAKDLGVSDKAVEKHIKQLGLTKPPRGYWQKNKVS